MRSHLDDIYGDAELLEKQIAGELTEQEVEEIQNIYASHPDLKEYVQTINSEEIESYADASRRFSPQKAYNRFAQQTGKKKNRSLYYWWTTGITAAIILIVAGMFTWKYADQHSTNDILPPGEQKGMLELADGSRIGIDKQQIDFVERSTQVSYNPGRLTYQPATLQPIEPKQPAAADTAEIEYHSFIIPEGGENSVILSDGTTVYLNAGSKLTYPVCFQGKRRIVVLEGEAFFDVAPDTEHPFIVHTKYGDIRVIGTAFNVNAYNNNDACYTTLVRGKVNITSPMEENPLELNPGEQAVVYADKMEKRQVHVEDYAGWVNGTYSFHEQTLEDIMNTLKRWYAADVIYDNPSLCDLIYTGSLKRHENINKLLNAFEMTGDFHYAIKGRTIYLYKNE